MNTELNNKKIKDISNIDIEKVFLHYTDIKNIESIFNDGLKPMIGINSNG